MDLRGCVNDANDWATLFESYSVSVERLVDEEATRREILRSIGFQLADMRFGDILFVQFSGHGTTVADTSGDEPDRVDEAICPYDVMGAGPIVDDELNWLFAQRPRGSKIVMIADSCFSGSVAKAAVMFDRLTRGVSTRRIVKVGGVTTEYRVPKFLPPRVLEGSYVMPALMSKRKDQTWILLSGCQDNQVSYDAEVAGRPCGAFSHIALANLQPGETYKQWMARILRELPDAEWPQKPKLTGSWWAKGRKVLS
jgi:hypothetical protein